MRDAEPVVAALNNWNCVLFAWTRARKYTLFALSNWIAPRRPRAPDACIAISLRSSSATDAGFAAVVSTTYAWS